MIWFHRLFPACMVLWPALFAALLSRRAPREAPSRGAARLWVLTLLALAVHAGVQTWLEARLAPTSALRVGWPVFYSVFASMLLWFSVAVPWLRARDPGWDTPWAAGAAVRSASLVPRERTNPVPRSAWLFGWLVFTACGVAMGWAATRGVSPFLLAGLGFWLLAGPLAARESLLEPEPLDPRGSPELQLAYAAQRRFRAWGFFAFGLLGTLLFAAISVLMVYEPHGAGLAGGILGSVFGLAGGLFGTRASMHRARINRLLHDLRTQ